MFQNLLLKVKNNRLSVMFIAAVGSVVFSLILISYIEISTKSQFDNINESWQQLHAGPELKGEYFVEIAGDLGYGGFIHKFKNYVLRQNPTLVPHMQRELANLKKSLSEFRATGVSPRESEALLNINNILGQYEQKLSIAQEAVEKGITTEELDKLVRIDDTLAIHSLTVLQTIWIEDWISGRLKQTQAVNRGLSLQKYNSIILVTLIVLGFLQIAWTRRLKLEVMQRTLAQRKLRRAVEELKRSNQDLEQYANAASHDLQEPLRKILSFGSRLHNSYGDQLDDDARDYLARMRNAASRMQSLITNLLEYSRVVSKAKPFQPVDLNHVLAEVCSNLQTSIEETSADVEGILLPVIDADPLQMQQLFQNLISNSLKYRSADRSPRIYVEGKLVDELNQETGYAQELCSLEFRDNGIGFNSKYSDKIFEIFQRLHGREKYEGTGVGLAICRKIIEHHKGTISVSSVEGEGSVFLIKLPVHQLVSKN